MIVGGKHCAYIHLCESADVTTGFKYRCPIFSVYSENGALFKCERGPACLPRSSPASPLSLSPLPSWPWQVYCLEASSLPLLAAAAAANIYIILSCPRRARAHVEMQRILDIVASSAVQKLSNKFPPKPPLSFHQNSVFSARAGAGVISKDGSRSNPLPFPLADGLKQDLRIA